MSEAAEALSISESTVRRRIHRGKLVARREPYGHSFRWLVRFPCGVDEPRRNLRLVPARPGTPAPPPSLSESTRLIASLGRRDATEVDAASTEQQASSMQETIPHPQVSESASALRQVPSASTRLIASLDRGDTGGDGQPVHEAAATQRDPQPEQASGRAFWLAVVVVAVVLGTLALEPPAWSRAVAIAVGALAAIMAMGEGAVGLWQAGSGEAERE